MDNSIHFQDWFWFLVTGGLAGWLASMLVSGAGLGVLGDIAIGVLGAFFGALLANMLGFTVYGFWGVLGVAVIGAVILLSVLRVFSPHKRATDR
jgi:uncharacterized membrane protein YeaQ/YmgE (transglycosylase-associated protein family)